MEPGGTTANAGTHVDVFLFEITFYYLLCRKRYFIGKSIMPYPVKGITYS